MLTSLLAPATAGAHTHLSDLQPEPEAVVQHAPDAVRLTFNQPVDVVARSTRIVNGGHDQRALVTQRRGGRQVLLRPRTLLHAGRVHVRFRVLSQDGHVLRGQYGFVLRRGTQRRADGLQVNAGAGGTTTGVEIVHGIHLLLFVLALGLALVGPLVLGSAGMAVPVGTLRGLCLAGAAVSVLLASLTWLAAEGEPVTHALLPATIGDAAGTEAGEDWLFRACLWLVAAAVAPSLLVASGALAAVALSLAMSGHAGTHGGFGSVLVDTVHLLAAGVWLGGLAVLLKGLRRKGGGRLPTGRAMDATDAFGRIAVLAFAVLVISGGVNAVLRLGSLEALVDESYGLLVLAKIAAAATIAVVAVQAKRSSELFFGTIALALASILVGTAPPA